MTNILDNFRLKNEKEDYNTVIVNIDKGVVFRGTNLWVLIFAIFVASLGLNVNSTAVIIGAMLISPLMGPIMGLGLSMAINDLILLRKSLINYLFAAGIGLITSTIYFLLSPINDAHAEILARTSPTIYDVLIALFGGFAGILATSSKQKGNVIPGVAIATALMPPLCTAGYGLATFQFAFLIGAIYLFIINTVFIALATFITVRLLKFPFKKLPDPKKELKAKRVVGTIVMITLLPSIYLGYSIVQKDKYLKKAISFVETEAIFPNDYLLKKAIDPDKKLIVLTYGGKKISENEIVQLKSKLKNHELENTTLEIRQGFAYLNENKENEQVTQLSKVIAEKDYEIQLLKAAVDSAKADALLNEQLIKEAKAIYPDLINISTGVICSSKKQPEDEQALLVYMQFVKLPDNKMKKQLDNWLTVRLNKKIKLIING